MSEFDLEELVPLRALGLDLDHQGGQAPVQVSGDIDGRYLYFRGRGNGWTLEINKDSNSLTFDPQNCEYWANGIYGEPESYDASFMPLEHAARIISLEIAQWREGKSWKMEIDNEDKERADAMKGEIIALLKEQGSCTYDEIIYGVTCSESMNHAPQVIIALSELISGGVICGCDSDFDEPTEYAWMLSSDFQSEVKNHE